MLGDPWKPRFLGRVSMCTQLFGAMYCELAGTIPQPRIRPRSSFLPQVFEIPRGQSDG